MDVGSYRIGLVLALQEGMTTETASLRHSDAASERKGKSAIVLSSQLSGTLWFAGWLFTTGYMQLVWWKVLLALVAWPYFLGTAVR